jgi:hypothetical protein
MPRESYEEEDTCVTVVNWGNTGETMAGPGSVRQKRPTIEAKETYCRGKKRPTNVKRDLL